jgi:multicomponent Na+:H+ antiporter subunit D
MALAPLPVLLPLVLAALLLASEKLLPMALIEVAAIVAAAATAIIAAWLAVQSMDGPLVYWFGGWLPHHDVAIGIAFVVDPAGAATASFAALLFAASFVFGWRYFEGVEARYHILMLAFLAGVEGLCLTGDLFNFFVFFELMSVAAFAVTAYKLEASSIEGALNFTVMNMIGSFSLLGGVALLYGATGALNLAQIGRALAASDDVALIETAFVLIFAGLFIKAAIVPFHFWLADAHAVAPTPVCVIFSGIMAPVALFGAGRIYWTAFAAVAPIARSAGAPLLDFGVATALIGGCGCYMQRHIKRLLAFSTVSHMGVMLAGFSLLSAPATSGFFIYLVGHGLIKGALFMIAGIVMSTHNDIDELNLRGQARDLPLAGLAFFVGGVLLAGLPLGLMADGRSLIDAGLDGARPAPLALTIASALTGAAVLRSGGRVFLGWGPEPGPEETTSSKAEGEKRRPSRMLVVPAFALIALGVALNWPLIDDFGLKAAARFIDQNGYAAAVLNGAAAPAPGLPAAPRAGPLMGWLGVALALALAGFELSAHMLPRRLHRALKLAAWPIAKLLDTVHSGHVGDYAMWATLGLAMLAGMFVL